MIWLIGNKGMLGQELEIILKEQFSTIYTSDVDVDITDREALASFSKDKKINWIINCSAYTAVDKAEEEQEKAYLINETGVRNIAETASSIGAKVIHISTDYIFDGQKETPLLEKDPTGPQSIYGKSKLAGEIALQKTGQKHFIIRTAWLYGQFGNNFVQTMLNLMNSKESLSVVDDQRGTPTWAFDLASFIITIIRKDSEQYGIYHYSNQGNITWFDFALEIYRLGKEKKLISSDCKVSSCTSAKFPTPAKRPSFSLLSKEKAIKTFGITVPPWDESLKKYLEHIKNEQKTN